MNYYEPSSKRSDLGTPASPSKMLISLTIDGQNIKVAKGSSVMRAALRAGIEIPKLCATDSIKAYGSCRLCLVKIKGRKGSPSSCTTPVEQGMEVETQNSHLTLLRRGILELYISEHPLECQTCPAEEDCELQDMAKTLSVTDSGSFPANLDHPSTYSAQNKDLSNPYFNFNPDMCIVCSRCVRACNDIQGTFALTVEGRGLQSGIKTAGDNFFASDCVSCGACVLACPTAALIESSVVELGAPEHVVQTTCAYCGVGCTLDAHIKVTAGETQVVRMVPSKAGLANQGHACVKGRFAWGYTSHKDRILEPMIRNNIQDEWQTVSWDKAINHAAAQLLSIQEKYGQKSVGAITSSRCTNEEVWVVQKLVRAAFQNNNVDTCARVCHSPTGYGLKQTFGTSAGTQDFDSVNQADVILLIGANPTDAHPVFASQMKRRLREGAQIIVVDPRKIDMVRTPHIEAALHLQLKPGTNVALMNAFAHVIVEENLLDMKFIQSRCAGDSFDDWMAFIQEPQNSPELVATSTGVNATLIRQAARLYAQAGNGAIYYGLGVTEHSQGSTMVMALANLAMATGNIGRQGVGINPLRGQNNVQGSCDMGSFPHELPGYQDVRDSSVRSSFEALWKVTLDSEPGYRIPNMMDAACAGEFKALYVQGEDIAQSDPNTQHIEAALASMECIIVQDLFLNETARFAHVFFPGTSFLEKDGTFTNAERRLGRVRPVMPSRTGKQEWEVTQELSQALGYSMHYDNSAQIMNEIAQLTPTFSGISHQQLDDSGSVQWPCNEEAPHGTPIMHMSTFTRGKGMFIRTEYQPTKEKTNRKFPLILTTGRILSQYNVGAQTRRTDNLLWMEEDVLEIHESDAEARGIRTGDWVEVRSRKGNTCLHAKISGRMSPGVIYTTFHHPESGTNVITTELSDWATECPEYKVTAVEVMPANHLSPWQQQHKTYNDAQRSLKKS